MNHAGYITHRSSWTGQTAAFLKRLNKIQINSSEAGIGYMPGPLAQPLSACPEGNYMGYILNFWKCKDGIYLDNQDVYERLSNGDIVGGLEELPITKILQRIDSGFASGCEGANDS